MLPTLHHWTSVSPRGPSGTHPQAKLKFRCVPEANPPGTEMVVFDGFLESRRTHQKKSRAQTFLKTSPRGQFLQVGGGAGRLQVGGTTPNNADDAASSGLHFNNLEVSGLTAAILLLCVLQWLLASFHRFCFKSLFGGSLIFDGFLQVLSKVDVKY